MLSFLRKKPSKAIVPDSPPPLTLQIDRSHKDTFATLSSELKETQLQITSLLEQKKLLENQLLEKEKENLYLLEKISELSTNFSAEKDSLLKQQKAFLEEEKILLTQIAELQETVSAKETEYQKLLESIPPIEAISQEKLALEEQIRLQQEQYHALMKQLTETENIKQKLERDLAEEKMEHQKTLALYKKEKSIRIDQGLTSALSDMKSSYPETHGLFAKKTKAENERYPIFSKFYPIPW